MLYLNKLFHYTCVYLDFYAGRQLFSSFETMKQLNKIITQINFVSVAPCLNRDLSQLKFHLFIHVFIYLFMSLFLQRPTKLLFELVIL